MSGHFLLSAKLCLFVIKLSFILCVDISVRNETENYPCELPKTEVIIGGDTLQNDSIVYNNNLYSKDQYFFTNVSGTEEIRICSCLLKPCIPTCCPFGMMNYSKCFEVNYTVEIPIYDNTTLLDGYKIDTEYVNHNCSTRRSREFHLQANGSLLEGNALIYTHDEYCVDFVEHADEATNYRLEALICVPEKKRDDTQPISIVSIFLPVSVVFLVLTVVVYCVLPELHNLHGYILITYLSCLIVFFIFLYTILTNTTSVLKNHNVCFLVGFGLYFFAMASYFWMNTMCFDIWRKLCGPRSWQAFDQSSIKKCYTVYSIYTWLMPILLTCILACMQFNKSMWTDIIYPGFGVKSCWFHDRRSLIVHLYIPIGILISSNFILFSATTYKIFGITRATRLLQENDSKKKMLEKERQRFFLYMKLFIVMDTGYTTNWILDMLRFFIAPGHEAWLMADVFDSLISVIIFIIFVLKMKILKLLMRRCIPCIGKKITKQGKTSKTSLKNLGPANLPRSSSSSTTDTDITSNAP